MVSRPFRNHGLTRKSAVYLVIGIWTYSLILTTPPLFGWGNYVHEAANIRQVHKYLTGNYECIKMSYDLSAIEIDHVLHTKYFIQRLGSVITFYIFL